MDMIMLRQNVEKEDILEGCDTSSKNAIWQRVIDALEDPTEGLSKAEEQRYAKKIEQKLKSGKRLTSAELNYLRIHNPELYKIAMRVENSRKALRQRLQNCKSKEEVQNVITGQMEVLKAMKGDPAQEYMSAMVHREIIKFKKSSDYARLPLKWERGAKRKKQVQKEQEEEDDEEDAGKVYNKAILFYKLQLQCDKIAEMTDTVLK